MVTPDSTTIDWIAADWGTSNLRVWAMGADGAGRLDVRREVARQRIRRAHQVVLRLAVAHEVHEALDRLGVGGELPVRLVHDDHHVGRDPLQELPQRGAVVAGRVGALQQPCGGAVEAARDKARAAGKSVELVVYPDAPHGFHADYRPSYREGDAKDGWARALAFLKSHGVG